jgi:Uroporphyrinogen decarboxylase (URO-D)
MLALKEPAALGKLRREIDQGVLAPVYETIDRVKTELPAEVALLGFCGAPWTLATYMVAESLAGRRLLPNSQTNLASTTPKRQGFFLSIAAWIERSQS